MGVRKQYKVVWQLKGFIWVGAKNEDDAKKKVRKIFLFDRLLNNSDMEKGLKILSIEEVKWDEVGK